MRGGGRGGNGEKKKTEPNHQRWYAKWKLNWNIQYTLHTYAFLHVLVPICMLSRHLLTKLSASELSQKFLKRVCCWLGRHAVIGHLTRIHLSAGRMSYLLKKHKIMEPFIGLSKASTQILQRRLELMIFQLAHGSLKDTRHQIQYTKIPCTMANLLQVI